MEGSAHPYRYRLAERADYPRLIELGRHFYEQTAYKSVPYSEEGAVGWLDMMLSHGLLFVAEAGDVIGFIGGISSPFIFNPAYGTGTELALWVEPDHRSAGVADALMARIEIAAKEMGLTFWSMMSLEAVRPEVAAKLYNKRGYQLAEHTFVKEL
jgi:GNAT superfamily N-acetyltransferase